MPRYYSTLFLALLFPMLCFAEGYEPAALGIGQVAQNAMAPVSVFADFIHSACFAIGASFLFAAIIKYKEHRRSPLMVPLSTVIFLLIAGVVLILLPLAAYITESGVHYSLFNK